MVEARRWFGRRASVLGLVVRTRRSGSGAEGVGGYLVSVLVADDDVVAGVGRGDFVLEVVGAEDDDMLSAGVLVGDVDGVAVLDHPDEEPVVDVGVDGVGVGIGGGEFLDVVEPCVFAVDCGEAEQVALGEVVDDVVGDVDDGVAGRDCHDVLLSFLCFCLYFKYSTRGGLVNRRVAPDPGGSG